jgi:GT2 family glycosyltransferase/2-polyprenyl-3-methyl-5-hydroxy-6-metoxy-1,4-benzoquinol methylase/glycosyltransferase involved in cell wall biosynthesis/Flp pilus assembly protein TadD
VNALRKPNGKSAHNISRVIIISPPPWPTGRFRLILRILIGIRIVGEMCDVPVREKEEALLSDQPANSIGAKLRMDSHNRMESNTAQIDNPASSRRQDSSIQNMANRYDTMFENRIETNPHALTMEFWKDHFAKRTVCELPEIRGEVLDIGCGTGEIDVWLARTKSDVQITAADISPLGLRIAQKNIEREPKDVQNRISFVRTIAEDLPFPSNKFDSCFISHTMEHIRDHGPILLELSRVLKPEAFVVIIVPFKFFHDDPTHVWHFDEEELKDHLSLYGDDVEVWKSPDGQQLAAKMKPLRQKKVIGMLRIKNEEKWIAKVLEKASPIVSGFVILDDGSTDNTPAICGTFSKVLRYDRQEEERVDEARDKNRLLKAALSYDPDWILALDGDEVLEDSAVSAIPKLLSSAPSDVTVIGVDFLYMWDSDDAYRVDGKYRGINHPRLFKVSGLGIPSDNLAFSSTQHGSNFHCGSVPSNMPGRVFVSDIKVKHYGYFESEQRERKKAFYLAHDPEQAAHGYYDHLTDVAGIELLRWKERTVDEVSCLKTLIAAPYPEGRAMADTEEERRAFEALPQYYKHLRQEIFNGVPESANDILDVGCGAGILGKALKARRPGRSVTGIELDSKAFYFATRNLDRAYNVDVESFSPPFEKGEFDCIILADILEHLKNPWALMKNYAAFLKEGATVVISIPNVRYMGILRDLAEHGKWEYQDEGILDRTHLRFFTRQEFVKLLAQAGITCDSVSYLGTEEMQAYRPQGPSRSVRIGNLEIHNVSDSAFDELSAYQILFIGTYRPETGLNAGMENHKSAEDLYVDAQSAIARADFVSAADILEKVLSDIPDHPAVLNDLAVVKAQLGRTDESLQLLIRVINIDPENQIARQNYDLLKQNANQAPTNKGSADGIAARIDQAEQAIQTGKYGDASQILNGILSEFPFNTDVLNDLAVLNILTGKLGDALRLIMEVLEIDPQNKTAISNMALVENAVLNQADRDNRHPGDEAKRTDGILPDDFHAYAVDSLESYRQYLSANEIQASGQKDYSSVRMKKGEAVQIDGYCWICKRPTLFRVDALYPAFEDAGGASPNWRERLVCAGCGNNSRIRAFVHLAESVFHIPFDASIYLTEQTTSLFRYFKNTYINSVGSEFLGASVPPGGTDARGIRNEDLTQLTFKNEQFDFVFSLEVLEHIPDYRSALREVLRVLKPKGTFIFTAPFLSGSDRTVIRATVQHGVVNHILPPEYHGDPLSDAGCLCYQQFGWDIISVIKELGFGDAAVFIVESEDYGYFGSPHLVFVAQKNGEIPRPEGVAVAYSLSRSRRDAILRKFDRAQSTGAAGLLPDREVITVANNSTKSVPSTKSASVAMCTPGPSVKSANPSPTYERINCPYCGSHDAAPFRKSADIVKCGSCATVYLRTRLTEEGMESVYQRYADEGSHLSLPKSEAEMRNSALRRDYFMDEIITLTKERGTFLDVGCAWGAFLNNAREKGFNPRGIEITRRTAEFAAKTLGLDVTSQQFLDTPFERNSLSVVSMIHVLEHLPYPKASLDKVFEILRPGGLFAGIVPNIESLSSAVLQDKWEWLQPMYHYVHYSPSTIKRHLAAAGFQIEKIVTTSGDCNRKSLEEVIRTSFSPKTDKEFNDVLKSVEDGGYGEEIRFFARKPVSLSPVVGAGDNNSSAQAMVANDAEKMVSDRMSELFGKSGLGEFELDKLYNESQNSISAGDIEGAIKFLQQILIVDPSDPRALNDLAVLHSVTGNNEEAIALLKRLVQLNTSNVIARKNLASLYLRSNRVEDALRSYYAALETSPNDTEVLLALASICVAIGKEDDGIMLFNRVLTIDPRNPAALEGLRIARNGNSIPPENETTETQIQSASASASGVKLVSIVIPVFNKWEYTENCLDSIVKNVRYPNYEVIVVDNASTDATQESMARWCSRHDRIKYIRNEMNLGFVDACNLGAEQAKSDYVLLLNNDTTVKEGWLESLVDFAEKTPDCGAVGSMLVYPDGRLQEAGGINFSDANGWNYGRGLNPNHPKFTFVREVDYISGASLMVRKDIWDAIGGLDRRYAPAYYEDADLCFAIRKLGYKVYYQPRSSVVHFEGVTSGTNLQQGFKKFQVINRPKFMEKWKNELAGQQRNDPRNVERASSRGIAGRILVIDPILPMFDRAAGSLHLFNILKVLREMKFHITFVATNLGLSNRYKPILEEMGIETYAGDRDAMRYFGYDRVYPSVDFPSLFRERQFDFALIDFWYQAEYYLPLIRKYSPSTRIIIDTEDVHFVRELREAELKGDSSLRTLALQKQKRELAIYKQADRVWVVTEQDKQALMNEKVDTPIDIRPVIHNLPPVRGDFQDREGILFVGNFNHTPNIDAVKYFVSEVLPEVRRSLPGIELNIVGNDPANIVGPMTTHKIHAFGYVQDLSDYYKKSRVVVAPLRFGAGLKGKIVEALSFGVPVVTTSIGVEGTGLREGEEVFVADDPVSMAAKIVEAYSNPETWNRLSSNGRSKMESTWSFEAGRKRIEEILLPLQSPAKTRGKKLASIVILTYNQLDYTKITIDSIRRHTKNPYEIIVIDNASSDGTVEYLEAQKDIRAVFNEENLGFPAGCNQGMEIAKGDYVVLLNNDVIVSDNWLEDLIECAESSSQIGIVGPMSNRISGYQLETNVSYKKVSQVHDFAAKYRRKNRKRLSESPRVAGFCMLIKRDLLDKIGGLDVAFGIGNCEDDDYCLRARLAGYNVVIAGDVFIHHFGSKSFGKDGLEKYKEFIRANEVIFMEKWGISPLEYWREGKKPTKLSGLSLPLASREPVPVEAR